jgi:hypothetical protein
MQIVINSRNSTIKGMCSFFMPNQHHDHGSFLLDRNQEIFSMQEFGDGELDEEDIFTKYVYTQ